MSMNKTELFLLSRLADFSALLERCEVTTADGAVLETEQGLADIVQVLSGARENRSGVYLIGNGGSASIASHAAVDFLHIAKVRALTLHDSALLTCMANDYGYEKAFSRVLEQISGPEDTLIAISSSGCSLNICRAAKAMRASGGTVITFSGFEAGNPLRSLGDVNIWLDARDYGLVELGHQFILHNIVDRFSSCDMESAAS